MFEPFNDGSLALRTPLPVDLKYLEFTFELVFPRNVEADVIASLQILFYTTGKDISGPLFFWPPEQKSYKSPIISFVVDYQSDFDEVTYYRDDGMPGKVAFGAINVYRKYVGETFILSFYPVTRIMSRNCARSQHLMRLLGQLIAEQHGEKFYLEWDDMHTDVLYYNLPDEWMPRYV